MITMYLVTNVFFAWRDILMKLVTLPFKRWAVYITESGWALTFLYISLMIDT